MRLTEPLIAALLLACTLSSGARAAAAPPAEGASSATDWPQMPHDHANTRYAPLDEITTANVAQLKLHASWFTGVKRGHEEGPIVAGDTMYLVGPWPQMNTHPAAREA